MSQKGFCILTDPYVQIPQKSKKMFLTLSGDTKILYYKRTLLLNETWDISADLNYSSYMGSRYHGKLREDCMESH